MDAPNLSPADEADRLRLGCVKAKLKFHEIGSPRPWTAAVEKLCEEDLGELLGSMSLVETDDFLTGVLASFSIEELVASPGKHALAMLVHRHEWLLRFSREGAAAREEMAKRELKVAARREAWKAQNAGSW